MAKVLLTYDVKKTSETVHSDLKRRLIEVYKYASKIQADDGQLYDLPNTCLIKSNTTREAAAADFKKACNEVNATWEKFVIVDYNGATFNNQ